MTDGRQSAVALGLPPSCFNSTMKPRRRADIVAGRGVQTPRSTPRMHRPVTSDDAVPKTVPVFLRGKPSVLAAPSPAKSDTNAGPRQRPF